MEQVGNRSRLVVWMECDLGIYWKGKSFTKDSAHVLY